VDEFIGKTREGYLVTDPGSNRIDLYRPNITVREGRSGIKVVYGEIIKIQQFKFNWR